MMVHTLGGGEAGHDLTTIAVSFFRTIFSKNMADIIIEYIESRI